MRQSCPEYGRGFGHFQVKGIQDVHFLLNSAVDPNFEEKI